MDSSFLGRGPGRIGYDVRGEGPLVVCVPGMGDVRSVFRFTVPALLHAGYRVATMDLRGHGDSSDGFDRYDDTAAATDLLALIDHLGGGPAVVMGERDADFPDPAAEGRYAAERLQADLLLVPNAGHYPMAEYPEVVNPVLVPFVDRVAAPARAS